MKAIELRLYRVFDLAFDVHPPSVALFRSFSKDKKNCSLNVVAFSECAFSFRDDIPCGGYAKPRRPHDSRQIRPYVGILMCEHHDL